MIFIRLIILCPYFVLTNRLQKYKKVQKYANKTDNFCQYLGILYLCTVVVSHAPRKNMSYIHRQVKLIAPVDSMQGMIGKVSDNVCGKAFIFNLKKAKSMTNNGKPFQYFSVRTATVIKLTAAQRAWNQQFGQICTQTRTRLEDPTHINTDRAEFAQQTKYKTLYSFVFNKVKNELEA